MLHMDWKCRVVSAQWTRSPPWPEHSSLRQELCRLHQRLTWAWLIRTGQDTQYPKNHHGRTILIQNISLGAFIKGVFALFCYWTASFFHFQEKKICLSSPGAELHLELESSPPGRTITSVLLIQSYFNESHDYLMTFNSLYLIPVFVISEKSLSRLCKSQSAYHPHHTVLYDMLSSWLCTTIREL